MDIFSDIYYVIIRPSPKPTPKTEKRATVMATASKNMPIKDKFSNFLPEDFICTDRFLRKVLIIDILILLFSFSGGYVLYQLKITPIQVLTVSLSLIVFYIVIISLKIIRYIKKYPSSSLIKSEENSNLYESVYYPKNLIIRQNVIMRAYCDMIINMYFIVNTCLAYLIFHQQSLPYIIIFILSTIFGSLYVLNGKSSYAYNSCFQKISI